jgi:hypothetical protein
MVKEQHGTDSSVVTLRHYGSLVELKNLRIYLEEARDFCRKINVHVATYM